MDAASQIEAGRAAFESGGWAAAYSALSSADSLTSLQGADLEKLAVAAYLTGHERQALDLWTRCHHAYLREGETARAIRCAFWLGFTFMYQDEFARSSGWFARARRLLEDPDQYPAEHGYILLGEALRLLWSGNPAAALPVFHQVSALASQRDEPDLAAFARLGTGDSLVQLGNVAEGMSLLDEVMAAVTAGDLSTLAVGIIYCAVIGCFQRTFDMSRAREWTAAFMHWCESQPEVVPFRGLCLVHRAEILQLEGAWPRAMEEVTRACESYSPDRYEPWAGEAFYQQAELYRLRGEYALAAAAYREASEKGETLQTGLALMRLAQGRPDAAVGMIGRLLSEAPPGPARARVLPAQVEIMLAVGDISAAVLAAQELSAMASDSAPAYLRALGCQAEATVHLASGQPGDALPLLRRALACWRELNTPYEAARVHVLLAQACRALGDEETATFEADAARETFTRLGATPDLDRLRVLFDVASQPGAGRLTEREIEVLRLVAAGQSNRQIAASLVVSEHTVRRHLQNIFARLDVNSRAAATAYAYQHGLI